MPKLINKRSDTLTKLDDNANDTEFGEEPYLNPVNKRLVERQMQLDWDKSTREDRYDAIMRLPSIRDIVDDT